MILLGIFTFRSKKKGLVDNLIIFFLFETKSEVTHLFLKIGRYDICFTKHDTHRALKCDTSNISRGYSHINMCQLGGGPKMGNFSVC